MKQQYINSKVFGHLMEVGGQSLVAVYAMLLNGRNGFHCYLPEKNSNNKITKGKRLISKHSGVSLTALDSHLHKLLDLGLCEFMNGGGFILVGSKKLKSLKQYKTNKKVPVRIGKNLRETKGNVNAVLITANIYRQAKQIDKKVTLNKVIGKSAKGIPLSHSEMEVMKKAIKNKSINLDDLKKVENTVLSNQGFSNVIRGLERGDNNFSVSHGGYWRKVLQERGFIHSRRRFKTIWAQKVSYAQYLSMRKWLLEEHGFVTYRKGRIVKPIVSEVMIPNINTVYNSKYILNSYLRTTVVEESTSVQ